MSLKNSKGEVYYGMHFYPGVAEYSESGKDPYRVFLNEDTLRSMDPSFAGRPVFVEHVDQVKSDLDELKKDVDGWVVESFYNSADGKHWVKFMITSERGKNAIQNGMRLSNAYFPKKFDQGGQWNGVSYVKQIVEGEFEHLALVDNPRYDESVIMTPEQFKAHNEKKLVELKRLANSKDEKENSHMGLKFFKRAKVENSVDLESTVVELPKSKKEMTISELVTEMDKIENMHGYANGDHMVKIGENEMSVNDLVKKHMEACNEMEEMKKVKDAKESDLEEDEESVDVEGDKKNEDDDSDEDDKKENELDSEDDEDEEDEEAAAAKKKNVADLAAKKAKIKEKAQAVKNAHLKALADDEEAVIETMASQVARGKALFGSR